MDRSVDAPSRLSGLWACVTGILLLTVVFVALEPAYHWWEVVTTAPRGCPNYGGNGNSSAFGDSGWDLILLLAAVSWLPLVLIEQLLPMSWRNRHPADFLARAVMAIVVSVAFVWFLPLQAAAACH